METCELFLCTGSSYTPACQVPPCSTSLNISNRLQLPEPVCTCTSLGATEQAGHGQMEELLKIKGQVAPALDSLQSAFISLSNCTAQILGGRYHCSHSVDDQLRKQRSLKIVEQSWGSHQTLRQDYVVSRLEVLEEFRELIKKRQRALRRQLGRVFCGSFKEGRERVQVYL